MVHSARHPTPVSASANISAWMCLHPEPHVAALGLGVFVVSSLLSYGGITPLQLSSGSILLSSSARPCIFVQLLCRFLPACARACNKLLVRPLCILVLASCPSSCIEALQPVPVECRRGWLWACCCHVVVYYVLCLVNGVWFELCVLFVRIVLLWCRAVVLWCCGGLVLWCW